MKYSMDKKLVLSGQLGAGIMDQTEGFTLNNGNPEDFCFTICDSKPAIMPYVGKIVRG